MWLCICCSAKAVDTGCANKSAPCPSATYRAAVCCADLPPFLRWLPAILVITVAVTLLGVELKRHGSAALVPSPFWGYLGVFGAWGAVSAALELKPPWMWLVQLLAAIVAWAQKVPTYVVVVVAVLLVMLLVLAVSLLAKLSVLPRG